MTDTTPTPDAATEPAHRFELADVQHVPARPMTPKEERERKVRRERGEYAHIPFECDPFAGRVSFSLFKRGPDGVPSTPGGPYAGTYSAGSGIVARDVLGRLQQDPAVRVAFRRFQAPKLRDLASAAKKYGRGYTADEAEAARLAARVWTPALVDVLGAMLSDVQGWPPAGYTFREWLDEGLADEMNAADALDCFEAIAREWRFLVRALGADFDRACDLAGRL